MDRAFRLIFPLTFGSLVACLLLSGCNKTAPDNGNKVPDNGNKAPGTGKASKASNTDPRANLNKIYKAYKTACSKLGRAPYVDDEFPTYLRDHGDPKAIMQGIGIRQELFKPMPEFKDDVMAWELHSKNDKYHVLFYGGKIDVLTSHELGARDIGVGKLGEDADREAEARTKARKKAEDEENTKIQDEAAKFQEERWREKDRGEADKDFVRLRTLLPEGPEVKQLQASESDWITRRAKVISSARKEGIITIKQNFGFDEYVGSVPLPTVVELLEALQKGSQLPVVAGGKGQKK